MTSSFTVSETLNSCASYVQNTVTNTANSVWHTIKSLGYGSDAQPPENRLDNKNCNLMKSTSPGSVGLKHIGETPDHKASKSQSSGFWDLVKTVTDSVLLPFRVVGGAGQVVWKVGGKIAEEIPNAASCIKQLGKDSPYLTTGAVILMAIGVCVVLNKVAAAVTVCQAGIGAYESLTGKKSENKSHNFFEAVGAISSLTDAVVSAARFFRR